MTRWFSPALPLASLVVLAAHCGKGGAPAAAVASASPDAPAGPAAEPTEEDAGAPMDDRETAAWARAQDGGEDDDARLADLVGCTGLRERAAAARLRPTALRAMAQCRDFSELPWLGEVAAGPNDADALAALDAVVEEAARPRRPTDPEDAEELHDGCGELLALARAVDRPAARRVRAIRALRMLSERGCVKRADIPTDLDPK